MAYVTDDPLVPWPVIDDDARCPCLSGSPFAACCAPFHRGISTAPTAERLMRSRYSAFVVGDEAYVLATWHPSTRPATVGLDPAHRFYRLDILGRTGGGLLEHTGTVEFEARFRLNGRAGSQRENSRFVKQNQKWFYLDGL
ncbi:YchJ family metal-binding protein [Subtercola sp. RTI3]|nr:YchJ family metal-binding protein [Subtercola sp. RTI3]MEA9983866.1 YchJ family metal-binding protein [Subtercola sp. RTI3]